MVNHQLFDLMIISFYWSLGIAVTSCYFQPMYRGLDITDNLCTYPT